MVLQNDEQGIHASASMSGVYILYTSGGPKSDVLDEREESHDLIQDLKLRSRVSDCRMSYGRNLVNSYEFQDLQTSLNPLIQDI